MRSTLPVVLVVGLRLGCLNHAYLTARAIAADGCRLVGWIGTAIDPEMARADDNLALLTARLPAPCWGVLPHRAGAGAFTHVAPPSMAADGSLRPTSSRCNRNQFPCDVQTRDQRQGFHAPVRKVNSRVQKTEEEAPRMARKLGSNGTNARIAGMLAVAILVAACGKGDPNAAGGEMPPPEVGVVTVKPAAVPLQKDLVGRLAAYRSADVRARVPGVLQRRVYEEGSDVKEGQLLFVIDPAPLQAALGQAVASQASAQANYANARTAAERARNLAPQKFISQSDLDNALAAERSASAAVQSAKAAVDRRAHQPGLRHGAFADQRPRRQAAGHRRRAGRPGRRDAADHRRPDRPTVRRTSR